MSNRMQWGLRRVVLWSAIAAVFVLLLGLIAPTPAAAQCIVRTDLPVYVVQRGDTLARIAARYNTTASVLAQINCLPNINRIFTGQQLRVPMGIIAPLPPTVPPLPPPNAGYQLRVNVQTFERGFMLWRADNSGITAYFGTTNGTLRDFPASVYGRLPDNPIPDLPPFGFVRPFFGFGKVWGNYADVRVALGWATSGEQGYVATITRYSRSLFDFTLPNGNRVLVSNSATWSLNGVGVLPTPVVPIPVPTLTPIPPPAPIVTNTYAAFQPFENGFFIWEAATGNVVAFFNNGVYRLVPVSQYGTLPDNPNLDPVPFGRVRPINAFGKVWGSYADIRTAIGWATTGEVGFNASFRTSSAAGSVGTCFALPDGRIVRYSNAGGFSAWQWVTFCA
jgi:murein DD-endopeptidase MepM/ murein hydrolase activator NlpD